jgi:hypothetical protein
MANQLQAGAAWLRDQLNAYASLPVTYRRGATAIALNATPGSSLLRVTDNQGETRTVRTDRDFVIRTGDLPFTPTDGDCIDAAIDGVTTERFEVTPVLSEPAWRYTDETKTQLRVHTKSLGVAP